MADDVNVDLDMRHVGGTAEVQWEQYPQRRQSTNPQPSARVLSSSVVTVDGHATHKGTYRHLVDGCREYVFVLATSEEDKAASYVIMLERRGGAPRNRASSRASYGVWERHPRVMVFAPCQNCDGVRAFEDISLLVLVSAFEIGQPDNREVSA